MKSALLAWLGRKPALAIILRRAVELNFRKEKAAIHRFLLPLKEGAQVLDIGSGTGEFAPLFPVLQYTGIDLDPKNIAYAKRHYPHRFDVADATALPFSPQSFSAALIVGVLHHLSKEDAAQALQELRRVLLPGGRALIMEDTHSPRFYVRFMQKIDQGAHIRSFEEWQSLIGSAFTLEEAGRFHNGLAHYSYFVCRS